MIRPHLLLPLFVQAYSRQVLNLFGSALIAYWPLWEASGSQAADISGNARNGSYSGVTLGQPGIGDGKTCPRFDGLNDGATLTGASLNAAIDTAEGSLLLWLKIVDAAEWASATNRALFFIYTNASNLIDVKKSGINALSAQYVAGGVTDAVPISTSSTAWLHLALTWSAAADQLKAYLNGAQVGATQTGLGAWSGAIAHVRLGYNSITAAQWWSGWLAHAALLNRPANPAEIQQAARL